MISYAPRPRIARWLYPMVCWLRIASPHFAFITLPNHRLHASASVWK